jgi:hypothetical protein
MTDLVEQLANYGEHFDRAIGHRESPLRSADHFDTFEPDEGDLIMVDIQTREPDTGQTDRRRWGGMAILAAAAVIIVIVAVALFNDPDETDELEVATQDVDTTPGAPESLPFGAESSSAIVDDYFAAFEAGDVDALIALFTPGTDPAHSFCFAETGRSPDCQASGGDSLESLEQLLAYKSAAGTVFIDPSCAPDTTSPTEVSLRCEYVEHPGVAQAVDGPTVPIVATFVVSPDGIHSITRQVGARYVYEPHFDAWLRLNHPEDLDGVGCCGWDSVEDARQSGLLAAQYAQEWAAFLDDNGCVYNLTCAS